MGAPEGASQRKGVDMKRIMAAIRPGKLGAVRGALTAIGVRGMTVGEMAEMATRPCHAGAEPDRALDFTPRLQLELVVPDALAAAVVAAIRRTAATGAAGDGRILVHDVVQAVRVRTGETDDDAL